MKIHLELHLMSSLCLLSVDDVYEQYWLAAECLMVHKIKPRLSAALWLPSGSHVVKACWEYKFQTDNQVNFANISFFAPESPPPPPPPPSSASILHYFCVSWLLVWVAFCWVTICCRWNTGTPCYDKYSLSMLCAATFKHSLIFMFC